MAIQLFANSIQDFACWLHTEVSGEQRGFKLLQQRRINLALASELIEEKSYPLDRDD